MANIPGAVTDPSRVRGENIELKSGGDTIGGYLARPATPGNYPGIVVIHEAFGLVEHIRDIARRFANIGYNALAPDLYARKGGPADPNDINTVFPVMFGKPDIEAVQDLEAAADYLRGLPGATGKVGAIGFCSGGRLLGRVHRPRHPRCGAQPGTADPGLEPCLATALPVICGVWRGRPEPECGARRGTQKAGRGRPQGGHDQDLQKRRPRFSRRLPAELPRRPGA